MPLDLESVKRRRDEWKAIKHPTLLDGPTCDALIERVEELEAALRPFAALADDVDRLRHEDDSTCPHRLKAGDVRRARTALSENSQEDR